MDKFILIALVALGGGVGSTMRFLVADWAQRLIPPAASSAFPIGTLLVNTLGSFALGFLANSLPAAGVSPVYRMAILVGLLGGFTTFSTYAFETFGYLSDGQWGVAALNFVLNNALALAAAGAGYRIAERIYGVTT